MKVLTPKIDYRRYARPCKRIVQTPVICHDGLRKVRPRRRLQAPGSVCLSRRTLRFRRGASRYASLADLYCAFRMAFMRGCYHQTLRPRRHLPKFSNSLCRHAGACVRLNLHLGWQAAESYVERSNAFALVPGHRLLPDCSAGEQLTLKAILSHDMRRSEDTGRSQGVPDNRLDVAPNALG